MTFLLCDVGGTFVRFALKKPGQAMTPPQKLRAADYPLFENAAQHFLVSSSVPATQISAFALAFGSRNTWSIDQENIAPLLPHAAFHKINDFEANAYGLLGLPEEDALLLNPSPSGRKNKKGGRWCVVGPGTGLGLAYILEGPHGQFVQKTHGGHMRPAFLDEESPVLFKSLTALRPDGTSPIYEDILSGPGLYRLYQLLASHKHLELEYCDTYELLAKGRNDPLVIQSLKIFHEWLGIFVHQAVAFGNSYGGVYLTGGIMDKLVLLDLFDPSTFFNTFYQKNVAVVMADVLSTPVYWVRDEYVSLRGLCTLLDLKTEQKS